MNRLVPTGLLAFGLLNFVPTAARAQDMSSVIETGAATQNALMTSHVNKLIVDGIIKGNGRGGTTASSYAVGTAYKSSPFTEDRTRDKLIQKMQAKSPRNAAAILNMLRKMDFVGEWERIASPYGLKRNDVADAVASHWVFAWSQANGGANVSTSGARGVRNQVRAGLLKSAQFKRLSPTQRQLLSEDVMMQLVWLHRAAQQNAQRGNSAAAQSLGKAMQNDMKRAVGLDMRALSLTSTGFVPKR